MKPKPTPPPPDRSPLVSEQDAARLINMSVHWLRQARTHGRGPAFLKFGRSVRYRLADLDAWIDGHAVSTRG